MNKRTALYEQHLKAGAKMVDFGGWDMPINYGSQIEEHHQVRQHAGVFDVSHMTIVDIEGESEAFLCWLLANDVRKLKGDGKALYTAMLNEAGGILDDLIVYRMSWGHRLVVNCATREKDLAWIRAQSSGFEVSISERDDLAMLAVQGPEAESLMAGLVTAAEKQALDSLDNFQGVDIGDWFIARTGYTGEAGFEIMLAADKAGALWQALLDAGVRPVGLGARDTLRLEAGMNLYGSDMDENVNPYQAAMGWTVDLKNPDRDFIGREAVSEHKQNNNKVLRGLVLKDRGVLRSHQAVILPEGEGEITSGSFSPTLGFSIALARLPKSEQKTAQVVIRKKTFDVEIVKPPFVREGKPVYKPL